MAYLATQFSQHAAKTQNKTWFLAEGRKKKNLSDD